MLYEALHNTLTRWMRLRPISLVLLVTEKCNARCIMCNIWKEGISSPSQLSLKDYGTLLTGSLFSRVSSVMLSGGEALLRPDIVSITEVLLASLPRLKKISIATNGLATRLIVHRIDQIAGRMRSFNEARFRNIELVVQTSFDGVSAAVHDRIRGPNAHERVADTLEQLMRLREKYRFLSLSAGCVIQPLNLDEVERMYAYLASRKIYSIFTVVCPGEYYYKNEESELIRFSQPQLQKTKDILRWLERKEPHIGKKFLYREYRNMLNGHFNKRGCPAMRDVITIEPSGKVIPCLNAGGCDMGDVSTAFPEDIWFSMRTKDIVATVEKEKCPTCMFACGASYLNFLRHLLLESWR